jgi:hypothetical protein
MKDSKKIAVEAKAKNMENYKKLPLHLRITRKGTLAPVLDYSILIFIKNKLHISSYFN